MRILLVTMSMDIGGAETHILELAKELKRRGHEVFVASHGGKYVEELRQAGIEHIDAPLHNKKPQNVMKSYQILKQTIQDKKIELVHSHTRITSFICGMLHKKMGFKYVTTAHWTFKVTPLFKLITNWGDATVAVSEDIKEYLIKNYNLSPENIVVTVNGIDTEKFSKTTDVSDIVKEFSLNPEARRIVYISRLDESRALVAKQLVNIAQKLNETIPNLEIVIVGGGDSFDEINTTADTINQSLNKKLIVMTNARTDINKFAACGEIFIGVSRSALEAMASEKSVIIAGNEGYLGIFEESKLSNAIETNFCCRGLSMSNEETLFEDIVKLMHQTNKEEQGKYNREVVKKYYSIEKMVNDTESAYQKVMK